MIWLEYLSVCCEGMCWVLHQVFTRWILGFISDCRIPIVTWIVFLGDNCKCGLSFPWAIANGIKANLVMPCDSMALQHNLGSKGCPKFKWERLWYFKLCEFDWIWMFDYVSCGCVKSHPGCFHRFWVYKWLQWALIVTWLVFLGYECTCG